MINSKDFIHYNEFFSKIKKLSESNQLPSKEFILETSQKINSILKNEIQNYREPILNSDNIPGGLLDFTKVEKKDVIVIPDLHARKDLILKILNYKVENESIFDLLVQRKIYIIFLGDILHSEGNKKQRWLDAYKEYLADNIFSDSMVCEMIDGLSSLLQVMLLKVYFFENVHILKGNHENIKNETFNGNFSFHKFAQEGQMVYEFMIKQYGSDVVQSIYEYENLLPLCAVFENIMISHAEPIKYFSKEQIIDYVLNPDVIEGLTWTANDTAQSDCVQKMLDENCVSFEDDSKNMKKKYITGHRPIKQKYILRQNGCLVQIHNPYKIQFAYIKKENSFNPDLDIIEI